MQRLQGEGVRTVIDNGADSFLYSSDSVITSMEIFDDKLFMGLQNGTLLSFDGSFVTL